MVFSFITYPSYMLWQYLFFRCIRLKTTTSYIYGERTLCRTTNQSITKTRRSTHIHFPSCPILGLYTLNEEGACGEVPLLHGYVPAVGPGLVLALRLVGHVSAGRQTCGALAASGYWPVDEVFGTLVEVALEAGVRVALALVEDVAASVTVREVAGVWAERFRWYFELKWRIIELSFVYTNKTLNLYWN